MTGSLSAPANAEHTIPQFDATASHVDVTCKQQLTIDFAAAKAARDAGIQAATDHADAVSPKWSDVAYGYLHNFACTAESFTSEDVRTAAYASEAVPTPPNERAWGGVFMRAARNGVLLRDGYDTARDPKVHCNVVTRWRSLVFQGAA